MKSESNDLLCECLRREEAHKNAPPPAPWIAFDVEQHRMETEHGPRYGCGTWFGHQSEGKRLKYRRAIDELAKLGFIVIYGESRLERIKLTAEGETVAKALHANSEIKVLDPKDRFNLKTREGREAAARADLKFAMQMFSQLQAAADGGEDIYRPLLEFHVQLQRDFRARRSLKD